MQKEINAAKAFIQSKCPDFPKYLVVLGSGLGGLSKQLDLEVEIPFSEIPHFKRTTAPGHSGALLVGKLGKKRVVCLKGRLHFYEGYSMSEVVFPFRVLAACGAELFFLTNAAGGIRKDMKPGDLMVITDHINLTGTSPLIGPNDETLGPRFPDMTHVYDVALRKTLHTVAGKLNLKLLDGVYAGLHGPTYETPAEIRYLRAIGADATGMSTVPEAVALRHLGKRVVGVSCITNMAAGMTGELLTQEEVLTTGAQVEGKFGKLVETFLEAL